MKIAVCLLLVAISCCFNLAASNCEKRCSSVCRQSQLNDVICLRKALLRNMPATVDAMTKFLCVYDKSKVSENKVVILRAIRNLQETAGCNLANLLGTGITLEALSLDVHGVLQNLLRGIHDLLMNLKFGDYIIPQCGPVKPLLTKISKTLFLYSVPRFIGQSQATIPIDRVTRLLALVQFQAPKLFQSLLEVLLGPGSLVTELPLSFDRLTGGAFKTVSNMGKTLEGTTEMVTGVTGGVLQSIGGTTGSIRGSKGLLNGLLPPVLKTVNSVVDTVGSTLGTVTNTVGGLLGGPNGGPLDIATGLIGNIADSKSGILGTVTNLIPNTLGGVLGGSQNGPLEIVTGLVPNIFGGDSGGVGSGANNGLTRIIPSDLGGSGSDDSATIQASGAVAGSLGENVGISAGGNLGISLGRPISNTGIPGESMMENGGVNDVGGSFSEGGVSRTMETSANGFTSMFFK